MNKKINVTHIIGKKAIKIEEQTEHKAKKAKASEKMSPKEITSFLAKKQRELDT